MIISDSPSPNFGTRAHGKKIKYLILHYTDTLTAFDALKIMQDPAREVSAHYLIDEDGSIMRLVGEEMRAWHAGKSWWEGETDINSCSIGIEIQNPGHGYGYRPFPAAQIHAVAALCRDIMARNNILPCHVLAHSDIAPGRKKDPGELFPWADLASQQVGIWPQITDADKAEAADIDGNEDSIRSYFSYFGYDARIDLPVVIGAFQRHFVQDIYQTPEKAGIADIKTLEMLCAVRRVKLETRIRV